MLGIEMFSQKLDEMLETRKKLIKQQQQIGCWEIDNKGSVLIHAVEMLLDFAKYKGLPVEQEKRKGELCYAFHIFYKETKIISLISEMEYNQLKKEGKI